MIELSDYATQESGFPLLTSSRQGLFVQEDYFIDKQANAETTVFSVLPYGCITYRHMSDDNIFHFNINRLVANGLVSKEYPVFTVRKEVLDTDFLVDTLNSSPLFSVFCIQQKKGGTRTRLYFKTLCSYQMFLPVLHEQQVIASFIRLLDKRIERQMELVETLKKYKRGVVAAILSHQLKFSDATGSPYPEWTSCTLQDAVDFLDGQRKPLESADRAKRQGQYPYYGASGIIDYIDDFIFDEPLLLLGEDGANILNRSTPLCFIAEGKYWVNNHAHVMRPKAGQNIKFLCELLESLDYTRYNTGTAQPKLNQEKCRRIELALPVYEEQCRIANFLSALDQRAGKAQCVLDYLLSNRAGLLQQLFI